MTPPDISKWLKTLPITLGIFFTFSLYLFLRRGYYNLYIINKAFGSTAVVLAGITLLLGPLAQKYPSLNNLNLLKRQLGLSALASALLHLIATYLQSSRFTPSWYKDQWLSVNFGIIAVTIWFFLAYLSSNKKVEDLGFASWKRLQSIGGRVAFLAIFLHLVLMKYPGWIKWLNGEVKKSPELANPSYPPASIFVFLFMVGVILFRLKNYVAVKK